MSGSGWLETLRKFNERKKAEKEESMVIPLRYVFSQMQTGHPLALLLQNALADYYSQKAEHKLI